MEGITKNKYGVKLSTLLSAMLNMQFRDNITVIRTKDTEETSQILIMLKEKLSISINDTRQITYESNVNISKKHNMTKNVVFLKQLSCIPGISDKIAKDIVNIFPSMKDLVLEYNSLNTERECERLLTNIDGIGMIISKKVFEFIF